MSVRVMVEMELTYELIPEEPEGFADEVAFFDRLMEHFVDHGAEDPAIGLDTGKREVTISVVAEGGDEVEAVHTGMSTIRATIHAIGGHTPGWPTLEYAFSSVNAVPVEADPVEDEHPEELVPA